MRFLGGLLLTVAGVALVAVGRRAMRRHRTLTQREDWWR